MQLVFRNSVHHLQSLMTDCGDCPATSLKIFGQPIIVRNVQIAKEILHIDKVLVPKESANALKLIEESFPSIDVEQFSSNITDDDNNINDKYATAVTANGIATPAIQNYSLHTNKVRTPYKEANLHVPL